jgi:hypothetical protein
MENTTPPEARRRRFARLLDAIDRFAFREPDLDALARGWEGRRDAWFVRSYRDPRWDSVTACSCGHRVVIGMACEHCGVGQPVAGRLGAS